MSVVALGSFKGAPGVTTTALALGSTWPSERRVVVAELDPSGGDIAARFVLSQSPGLVSLAAKARKEHAAASILEHCQQLSGTLDVLVGPPSGEHARKAIVAAASSIERFGQLDELDVIADFGRLDSMMVHWPLLKSVDLAVVVTRPTLSELQHVAASLEQLHEVSNRVAVLLVGEGQYSASEITETFDVDVLGTIAHDDSTAKTFGGGSMRLSRFARSQLLRSARNVAGSLAERIVDDMPENSELSA